jgi:hypothetical protein
MMLICYYLFMIATYIGFELLIWAHLMAMNPMYFDFILTCRLLFIGTILIQIISVYSDPGRLKADNSKIDFMTLLLRIKLEDLCSDCLVIKTPRSKHCMICGYCVDRYDHHCGWLNLCVGRNNLKRFHAFVFVQLAYLVFATLSLCFFIKELA